MLALVGAVAILSLLAAVLSNRVSPLAALILVPVAAALVVGAGADVPGHILDGIGKISPVAGMFVFAILFFGVMTDAGVLAPLVGLTLRLVGRKPARITVGTAALALLIHLDGSGAVCFLVTIPALRPLYDELGMDRRILACTASMAAGVNFLPWTSSLPPRGGWDDVKKGDWQRASRCPLPPEKRPRRTCLPKEAT